MIPKKWYVLLAAAAIIALALWGAKAATQRKSEQLEPALPGQSQSQSQAQPKSQSQSQRQSQQESEPEVSEPEVNVTPSGAVTALIEAVRSMDTGVASQWVTALPEGLASDAYHDLLAPVLSRIEFEIGAEKISGDTAEVDVTITAVDVSGALGGASAQAASYLMSSMISRTPVDWIAFMTKYFSELDASELVRVSRDATVYLVKDSGGKWRVDTANADNEPFMNALTGGALEAYEKLQKLVG